MSDEKSEQATSANHAEPESAPQCGPGCDCATTGLPRRRKVIVFCLVMAIAAAVVVARGFARKAESETVQGQNVFTTTATVSSPSASPATTQQSTAMEAGQTQSSLWGEPLKDVATLNEMAAQTDAVFLYLPEKGRQPDETVKQQIEKAADKAQAGGMKMSFYTLDAGSQDYAQVTSQMPAPCVLAMVKGRGMSPVTSDFSEAKLLQALIAASRASGGCCPTGGGSSSTGCNK